MKKQTKFIVLTILLLIGRVYDVYSTSLYTPDLKKESNIIVNIFGTGWAGVLLFQAIGLTLVIGLLYYYLFKFKTVKPTFKNLSLKEYISYFFFNDKNSFGETFYKIPKNLNGFFGMTGYVSSMTLLFASYIVGTSTTLLLFSKQYKEIYKSGVPVILYAIIILLAFYFTVQFFKAEYIKYREGTLKL